MATDAEGELEGLGVTTVSTDAIQSALVEAAELGPDEARQDLLGQYKRVAWELKTVKERLNGSAAEGNLESALLGHREVDLRKTLEDVGGALDEAGIPRPEIQLDDVEEGSTAEDAAGSKAASLEQFDVFAGSGREDTRDTGLVETERDRLIRLGVLTPFDDVRGFERRVMHSSDAQEGSFQRMAERLQALQDAKRTSQLVDASELPQPERAPIRVEESYWKQGGSQYVRPMGKKRRCASLGRTRVHGFIERDDTEQLDFEARRGGMSDEGGRMSDEEDRSDDGSRSPSDDDLHDDDEPQHAHPASSPMVEFEGGFKMRVLLYDSLFEYQRTAVKWLWELHTQRAGGILGDEMGLGKTVQMAAFLSGLVSSGLYRPSLIVCPATVLQQWLRELRVWAPELRVSMDANAVKEVTQWPTGLLLTTYERLRLNRDTLLPIAWGYVILDEGHRIRNPDTDITLTAKQVATVHRLILTGAPIQNRLTELWSLFDFVFPGRLGTLPVFQAEFGLPIAAGGYANASALQVSTAYRCAVVLRDLVSPYLLRRRKADVALSLPPKTERVLFCTLTGEQRAIYKAYLASRDLRDIFAGRRAALAGIDILRKICNHPDLLDRPQWEDAADYGAPERSGKLIVLDKVLGLWHQQHHKALVFTQTQQMLDIVEKMVVARNYTYHRMDGATAVSHRAPLIDDFNANPDVFLFLLTTRVGGLGVNLTGANRIVVFDPDWNFSTDVQARERAWRIGQRRDVTVYRFITSGTIEEKIYHRQVYKHFLSDKVLRDPRQRRFFKSKDMQDLFTLGSEYQGTNETATMFAGAEVDHEMQEHADGGHGDADGGRGGAESSLQSLGLRSEQATAPVETDGTSNDGTSSVTETALLKELFDGAGLHSALDHAVIEAANDPAKLEIDREAGRAAKAAVEALRASRAALASAPISQPTWTGRSGGGQATSSSAPRFGRSTMVGIDNTVAPPSSSELLARMRARARGDPALLNGRTSPGGKSSSNRSPSPVAESSAHRAASSSSTEHKQRAQRLAAQVVEFLESVGGSAPSESIIERFREALPATDLPIFRGVLKSVASLKRNGGAGGNTWVLKTEFRGIVNAS